MSITISDEQLRAAHQTEADVRATIALALYASEAFTAKQAAAFVGLDRWSFLQLCRTRGIEVLPDADDLGDDLETLKRLGY